MRGRCTVFYTEHVDNVKPTQEGKAKVTKIT